MLFSQQTSRREKFAENKEPPNKRSPESEFVFAQELGLGCYATLTLLALVVGGGGLVGVGFGPRPVARRSPRMLLTVLGGSLPAATATNCVVRSLLGAAAPPLPQPPPPPSSRQQGAERHIWQPSLAAHWSPQ